MMFKGRMPVLVALGIWVACITTDTGNVDAVPTEGPGEVHELESAEALVDVTPQIPDGPVVQAYQKLVEKQKLSAEIDRQKQMMGPIMDRGDAKKKAKKKEMEMLAEVEIKNRISKKELGQKKKQKEDEQLQTSRTDAAKARRLERYEKWSVDEVKRNHERLAKLHTHTSDAFNMAKKLFKRKQSTKASAIASEAESKAEQKMDLRVGGYLGLKGDQINFSPLVNLNDKIAKAMQSPEDDNIMFSEKAFDAAAKAVEAEQAGFARKEAGWKESNKKVQDEKEQKEIALHNKKLDELAAKVAKEQAVKKQRKNTIEADRVANEINEKGKWKQALDDVKQKREDVKNAELKAKNDFNRKIEEQDKEKKEKAPGLLVDQKKKKFVEREEKYNGLKNGSPSDAYVAKQMKVRACEEYAHAKLQLAQQSSGRRLLESVLAPPPTVESAEKDSAKCKLG